MYEFTGVLLQVCAGDSHRDLGAAVLDGQGNLDRAVLGDGNVELGYLVPKRSRPTGRGGHSVNVFAPSHTVGQAAAPV